MNGFRALIMFSHSNKEESRGWDIYMIHDFFAMSSHAYITNEMSSHVLMSLDLIIKNAPRCRYFFGKQSCISLSH